MSEAVRGLFPDFPWSVEGLLALTLDVEEMPLDRFDWLLDIPLWRWMGRRRQLSLRDVIDAPERYAAHVRKAIAADAAYPIHVSPTRDGHLIILDGHHRLLRAILTGQRTIPAMRVTAADLDDRGGMTGDG